MTKCDSVTQILIGQRVFEGCQKTVSANTSHLQNKKKIDKCLVRVAEKLQRPMKINLE